MFIIFLFINGAYCFFLYCFYFFYITSSCTTEYYRTVCEVRMDECIIQAYQCLRSEKVFCSVNAEEGSIQFVA
jgi:hypothetical protein